MNKCEVVKLYVEAVEELNVTSDDVIVGAGAAAVLYGAREETSDLDLALVYRDDMLDLFHALEDQCATHQFASKTVVEFMKDVDLHMASWEETTTIIVDGVKITLYTVDELIRQKTFLLSLSHRSDEKKARDRQDISRLQKIKEEEVA